MILGGPILKHFRIPVDTINVSDMCDQMDCTVEIKLMNTSGITPDQNFRATSRLRPGDLERCFNKQGDTRLHVAAVLTR